MITKYIIIPLLCLQLPAYAQLKITNVSKLPLPKSQTWSNVQAADAKSAFFTTSDYQGIWRYVFSTKSLKQITNSPRSGYGFAVSPDGKSIAFRRTLNEARGRVQEVVLRNLSTGAEQILSRGENLSTPSFAGTKVVYANEAKVQNLAAVTEPVLLGIEDTKIVLLENGVKRLLDPLAKAGTPSSYIWPQLSPDGKLIVVTEMSLGAFVCDLKGNIISRLGRRNCAVWTRDGKWLVYMKDVDDGHNITGSDLFSISSDGKKSAQLTRSTDKIELYPFCSPVEDKIFCNTLDGDILVMTYAEVGR
ncbi:MAG: PD40 domain-containing protein [Ignavibacteriae bacterium]|nr:PD40 domain-containing protein [Ignavibacteriota bacterium]